MQKKFTTLIVVLFMGVPLLAQPPKANPFSHLGYEVKVATLTDYNEEFHDSEHVVQIGQVWFDIKKKKVVGFVSEKQNRFELVTDVISTSIDPHCEKYPWISPYAYCFNNPIKFIDPDGMDVVLGNMTEEQQKMYWENIMGARTVSPLFDAVYSSLENSSHTYTVSFGQTSKTANGFADGSFIPNKNGGGDIVFNFAKETLDFQAMAEEHFHVYQFDNLGGYAAGEFNLEFEAKIATTVIGLEAGGFGEIRGAQDFQNVIVSGKYGNNEMVISPSIVTSSVFIGDYKTAANNYSNFNRMNNIGNSYYRTNTTVAPYSLQKMIQTGYGK